MGAKNRAFQTVRANRPGRSMFDLSYEKKFTCDMGKLIPIMVDECVPGDFWQIGNMSVVRFQPMVAPVLHEINQYVHYFFVPYRLLWEDWEKFISGGPDGDDASTLPRWNPTSTVEGSLWDYFGFPTGINPAGALPMDFMRSAYNFVYNEFYRDQTLQPEVALTNENILNRAWEKDYFTSALPWQQRGDSPALPYGGNAKALWPAVGTTGNFNVIGRAGNTPGDQASKDLLEANAVDLGASLFDIADLRVAWQIQRWLERNARAGVRYTEFLKIHFGPNVAPRDDRLQRPEYIGGSKNRMIISEVLQTSATSEFTEMNSPQGNLAGHGIGVGSAFAGKYKVQEYGLIIGIMSIMPRSAYQDGINRQWLRETKYDFYFPEFAHLSEQAIVLGELCAKDADSVHNKTIFGYQGRYDEMRTKNNQVCAGMRNTFDYWHLGRKFSPAAPPALNAEFIECVPDKRIFAVQNEDVLIVSFGNLLKVSRPMPVIAEPGFVDH